jgi:hypothetical protein
MADPDLRFARSRLHHGTEAGIKPARFSENDVGLSGHEKLS